MLREEIMKRIVKPIGNIYALDEWCSRYKKIMFRSALVINSYFGDVEVEFAGGKDLRWFSADDYGKTWAFTMEELDNDEAKAKLENAKMSREVLDF